MSTTPDVTPYGAWESPIDAAMLAADSVRLSTVLVDGDDVLWLEGRPTEAGRNVLVRCGPQGETVDVTPAPWNLRSRVHEYGGGAVIARADSVWLVNDADQRLYRLGADGASTPLTPEGPFRHADPDLSPDGRHLVCVREEHGAPGEPRNLLVMTGAREDDCREVATGHDFYAYPRFSPDGQSLAFIAWDHPHMPWDGTTLYVAAVRGDGTVSAPRAVAGGEGESIFQPQWAADGSLWFVSDAPGYWNLFHLRDVGGGEAAHCVLREEAEFGLPLWQFAMSTYGFVRPGLLAAASCHEGRWQVETIDLASGVRTPMPHPVSAVSALVARDGVVAILAASEEAPLSVIRWRPEADSVDVLRASAADAGDATWVSRPETVSFPTGDGDIAHGFFYPPASAGHRAPDGERPPLLVVGHGGPTGATTAALDLSVQFWTSRGFAVLDVNYRGSTGYGRAYRGPLDGQWGIVDVEDCVNGARHLASEGRVDGARLAIRGRSAGGYTVLAALAFHDVFSAGASYYGIADLEALARDTHKFESRYLDTLVGPYPEGAHIYRERSPIQHVDGLSCPVIFFQGLEDAVVPPNQAQMMRDALLAKGVPVACLMFEGEQHGFRRALTIVRALEAELAFYGEVFGFVPAGDLPPVEILRGRGTRG